MQEKILNNGIEQAKKRDNAENPRKLPGGPTTRTFRMVDSTGNGPSPLSPESPLWCGKKYPATKTTPQGGEFEGKQRATREMSMPSRQDQSDLASKGRKAPGGQTQDKTAKPPQKVRVLQHGAEHQKLCPNEKNGNLS